MKATGIVRRIDDLGRVVIPKEIRRTLRIREGDPLEIFTDREGEVILKKYSPIGELANFAGQYAESIAQALGCLVCICDTDQVITASGNGRKELQDKYISSALRQVMDGRRDSACFRRQPGLCKDCGRTGGSVCRRGDRTDHLRRGQHRSSGTPEPG